MSLRKTLKDLRSGVNGGGVIPRTRAEESAVLKQEKNRFLAPLGMTTDLSLFRSSVLKKCRHVLSSSAACSPAPAARPGRWPYARKVTCRSRTCLRACWRSGRAGSDEDANRRYPGRHRRPH